MPACTRINVLLFHLVVVMLVHFGRALNLFPNVLFAPASPNQSVVSIPYRVSGNFVVDLTP